MNTEIPLLSIIIATKNRQRYVLHAIESILSIPDNRVELVIQDNGENNSLYYSLSKYSEDKRLRYRYTPPPFSSTDNFNAGIELSTGEYICLIGDDDGVNPEIIDATFWAKCNNIDALVGNIAANYRWDNISAPDTLFTKMTDNTLIISHFTSNLIYPNIKESLLQFSLNGCTYYLDFALPKLYHGIVKRNHMEFIKKKTGNYLSGLSPDIYASITLACIVQKMAYIDYPLTIPGVCAESGSIQEGQIKKHSKRLEDAPHFRDRGSYYWSEEVPRIYCVETIWADSGIAALRDMDRHDLIKKFNKYKLYAHIINRNRSVTKDVLTHMSLTQKQSYIKQIHSLFLLFLAFTTGPIYNFLKKRAFGRLMIILGKRKHVTLNDIDNIFIAMNALTAYLKKNNIKLSSILSLK